MPSDHDDAETPNLVAASQPFVRKQIQWGRPPSTVFQIGRLPKATPFSPLPDFPTPRPARPIGGGILSGSMIPRAAPARSQPTLAAIPSIETSPALTPVTVPVPAPRIAPTPLPIEPEIEASPTAPAHARPKPRNASRNPLIAGGVLAVLAVAAAGVWVVTRPDAPTAPAVTTPSATPSIQPAVAAPTTTTSAPAASPAQNTVRPTPVRAATPPARTIPARTLSAATTQTARPSPNPAQPARPQITVQPLVVNPPAPAPTAARQTQADPDAPITTRPQPLN